MRVTLNVVRIYESKAYLATENEPTLPERTIVLPERNLDEAGATAQVIVHLGPPPLWVTEAACIRRMTGAITLNLLRGIVPPAGIETAFDEALAEGKTDPPFPPDRWYVTFIAQHDIEVPSEANTNTRFGWMTTDLHHQAEQFRESVSYYLDELVVLASTEIAPSAFAKLRASDWICLTSEGRTPFSVSEGSLLLRATVSRLPSTLNLDALEKTLQSSATTPGSPHDWLGVVAPWWLAGMREEDSWKKFMQLFISLELLHGQLRGRYNTRARSNPQVVDANTSSDLPQENVIQALFWPARKPSPAQEKRLRSVGDLKAQGEFASMALALFPGDADTDLATFDTIRHLRNAVAHGERRIADTVFPTPDLETLLVRYLRAAVTDPLP